MEQGKASVLRPTVTPVNPGSQANPKTGATGQKSVA